MTPPQQDCSTCVHHARPQWDTGGFGTCSEVVRRGLVKLIGSGYLATRDTFTCCWWADKRLAEMRR